MLNLGQKEDTGKPDCTSTRRLFCVQGVSATNRVAKASLPVAAAHLLKKSRDILWSCAAGTSKCQAFPWGGLSQRVHATWWIFPPELSKCQPQTLQGSVRTLPCVQPVVMGQIVPEWWWRNVLGWLGLSHSMFITPLILIPWTRESRGIVLPERLKKFPIV